MKKIITACFLILLMGCSKDDENIDIPTQQPLPEGARMVTIAVDESYDLKETMALSVTGSSQMTGETNKISIPDSFESATFFLKKGTEEVLAVVKTNPSSSTITVNANTVAQALMNLIPAYHSLSEPLKDKFENDAPVVKVYQDFVVTIDKLLKNGESVYSSDPEYIDQLVELDNFITATYLVITEENRSSSNADSESKEQVKESTGILSFLLGCLEQVEAS
jgi:hypothetical protein